MKPGKLSELPRLDSAERSEGTPPSPEINSPVPTAAKPRLRRSTSEPSGKPKLSEIDETKGAGLASSVAVDGPKPAQHPHQQPHHHHHHRKPEILKFGMDRKEKMRIKREKREKMMKRMKTTPLSYLSSTQPSKTGSGLPGMRKKGSVSPVGSVRSKPSPGTSRRRTQKMKKNMNLNNLGSKGHHRSFAPSAPNSPYLSSIDITHTISDPMASPVSTTSVPHYPMHRHPPTAPRSGRHSRRHARFGSDHHRSTAVTGAAPGIPPLLVGPPSARGMMDPRKMKPDDRLGPPVPPAALSTAAFTIALAMRDHIKNMRRKYKTTPDKVSALRKQVMEIMDDDDYSSIPKPREIKIRTSPLMMRTMRQGTVVKRYMHVSDTIVRFWMKKVSDHDDDDEFEEVNFRHGDVVLCGDYIGVLRYLGPRKGRRKSELFLGLECVEPMIGGHNGTVDGVLYFHTEANDELNRGVLLPIQSFTKVVSPHELLIGTHRQKLLAESLQSEMIHIRKEKIPLKSDIQRLCDLSKQLQKDLHRSLELLDYYSLTVIPPVGREDLERVMPSGLEPSPEPPTIHSTRSTDSTIPFHAASGSRSARASFARVSHASSPPKTTMMRQLSSDMAGKRSTTVIKGVLPFESPVFIGGTMSQPPPTQPIPPQPSPITQLPSPVPYPTFAIPSGERRVLKGFGRNESLDFTIVAQPKSEKGSSASPSPAPGHQVSHVQHHHPHPHPHHHTGAHHHHHQRTDSTPSDNGARSSVERSTIDDSKMPESQPMRTVSKSAELPMTHHKKTSTSGKSIADVKIGGFDYMKKRPTLQVTDSLKIVDDSRLSDDDQLASQPNELMLHLESTSSSMSTASLIRPQLDVSVTEPAPKLTIDDWLESAESADLTMPDPAMSKLTPRRSLMGLETIISEASVDSDDSRSQKSAANSGSGASQSSPGLSAVKEETSDELVSGENNPTSYVDFEEEEKSYLTEETEQETPVVSDRVFLERKTQPSEELSEEKSQLTRQSTTEKEYSDEDNPELVLDHNEEDEMEDEFEEEEEEDDDYDEMVSPKVSHPGPPMMPPAIRVPVGIHGVVPIGNGASPVHRIAHLTMMNGSPMGIPMMMSPAFMSPHGYVHHSPPMVTPAGSASPVQTMRPMFPMPHGPIGPGTPPGMWAMPGAVVPPHGTPVVPPPPPMIHPHPIPAAMPDHGMMAGVPPGLTMIPTPPAANHLSRGMITHDSEYLGIPDGMPGLGGIEEDAPSNGDSPWSGPVESADEVSRLVKSRDTDVDRESEMSEKDTKSGGGLTVESSTPILPRSKSSVVP